MTILDPDQLYAQNDNPAPSFFFYDLETTGTDPKVDRIMQFAGQRTDLNLNPIGQPVNLLIKLNDDTLPNIVAIRTTKITPQSTQFDGLTEAEFARYLDQEIFTPDTIAVGYNSVKFDNNFIRYLFWRNFYDPYAWSWKSGRSFWDILPLVRLTRALRPDGINWPFSEDQTPSNRLEELTKHNQITHLQAHDALSDVTATIAVAKLIKNHQPKLFDYFLNLRNKQAVSKLVNLENPKPFVHISPHFDPNFNYATVSYPLAPLSQNKVLVYDLRHNPEDFDQSLLSPTTKTSEPDSKPRLPFTTLTYNQCPAIAPLGTLNSKNWKDLNLSPELIKQHLDILLKNPTLAEQARAYFETTPEFDPPVDSESALYQSFTPPADQAKIQSIPRLNAEQLADFHPDFSDPRLPSLLLHYKARNFPNSLSSSEQQLWEKYRTDRINRMAPNFLAELRQAESELPALSPETRVETAFILEELSLWYQSILP